jgi:hypothetical protein
MVESQHHALLKYIWYLGLPMYRHFVGVARAFCLLRYRRERNVDGSELPGFAGCCWCVGGEVLEARGVVVCGDAMRAAGYSE